MRKSIIIVVTASLFISSCNTVRSSAGVNRKVIDEYSVIENPPLVVPPNFNLLPPDQIESKKINDTDSELAKEILFGLDETENDSNNDSSLMKKIIDETNANEVDGDIREFVDQEFAGEVSSVEDEEIFENKNELEKAIIETENKKNILKIDDKKKKKKKRFIFF